MIPSDQLTAIGHDVRCVSINELDLATQRPEFFQRDVFVIGKALLDLSRLVGRIRANSSAKVVIDLCDNVFKPPEDGLAPVYRRLLPLADAAVMSSEALRVALAGHLPNEIPSHVIPDAVEDHRLPPSFFPREGSLRMVWFGYPTNIQLLVDALPKLRSLSQRYATELTVISSWKGLDMDRLISYAKPIKLSCITWSQKVMREGLETSDLVLIPSDNSPARVTKSSNRVITGLWAGKYVVAHPLPSYVEFADYAGIDADLCTSIEWAMQNQETVRLKILRGQDFIAERFGPPQIAQLWESMLSDVVGLERKIPIELSEQTDTTSPG